jgi:hypothetical protein
VSEGNVAVFKQIDPDTPVQAEKAYLKIEMAAELGAQKLHFSTVVDRDAPMSELKDQLERLSSAADWLGIKYSVRNNKVILDQALKDLTRIQADQADWMTAREDAWTLSGRRGPFKLHGTDQTHASNYHNNIHKQEEHIKKLRHDIKIAETLLNVANE